MGAMYTEHACAYHFLFYLLYTGISATDRYWKMSIMQSIKLVTVGDDSVGKRAMCVTYTENRFPEEYFPAIFEQFSVDMTVDGKHIRLEITHTAAQEGYERVRPAYYSETDVFLVIFSLVSPDSFENVRAKWLPEIAHYCPGTPFLLVGAKLDLRDDPATIEWLLRRERQAPITYKQGVKMQRKIGAEMYLECSAKTREGLEEVFETALQTALEPNNGKTTNCQ